MSISVKPAQNRRDLAGYARGRAILMGGLLALAAGASLLALDGPVPHDASELASALGAVSQGFVRAEDVRWEPSGGLVSDLALGRFVIFLASETANGPRDVHRGRVRLSPEGRPLAFGAPRNLTSTPLGDDHALVVRGTRAAYATFAFGQEQSVTALDLAGEGAQNVTKKLHDRVMAAVTNWQLTGGADGVARVDVTLEQPAQRVGLSVSEESLDIALADDDRSTTATRSARLTSTRASSCRRQPRECASKVDVISRSPSCSGPSTPSARSRGSAPRRSRGSRRRRSRFATR